MQEVLVKIHHLEPQVLDQNQLKNTIQKNEIKSISFYTVIGYTNKIKIKSTNIIKVKRTDILRNKNPS